MYKILGIIAGGTLTQEKIVTVEPIFDKYQNYVDY
jgi:hypothetical protein